MKYFSKTNNLRIVLRQGLPAEPLTGRLSQPGLYVRFEDGMADISDSETMRLMEAHPGFNRDFIKVEDDPFATTRVSAEPVHQISELQHGSVVNTVKSPAKVNIPPELKGALETMAAEMAKKMAVEMAAEMVRNVAQKSTSKPKLGRRPGRPRKNKPVVKEAPKQEPPQEEAELPGEPEKTTSDN